MNFCQMDSTIIQHTGILIQSGFSVVCIDMRAPQHQKPIIPNNQTYLLSLRTKNVNFDTPKGYLPLIFFQQNLIYIILGYRWVNLDSYIGHMTHLKNGHFSTEPPNVEQVDSSHVLSDLHDQQIDPIIGGI